MKKIFLLPILLILNSCGLTYTNTTSANYYNTKKHISYEGADRDNGIVYIGVSFSTIDAPSTLRFDEEERTEMANIATRICGNWGDSYESVYQLPSQGSKCINYDCTKRKMIIKMLCQK